MNPMRRALGILPMIAFVLAACAAPNSGGVAGGDESQQQTMPGASHDIEEITISENIDEVFVDDLAFLFSGTEVEGQLLVVVTPDAAIDKEIEDDRVVTVTGSLVPFTAEDLEAASAGISIDDEMLADFEGDIVLVAAAISDPLAG